jgi:hypothetical protein
MQTTQEGSVDRASNYSKGITPADGFELGLEFLRARRAQNLSWMRLAEQSLTALAQMHSTAGASGAALGRVWSAQAALVRDTARLYRSVTTHLAG